MVYKQPLLLWEIINCSSGNFNFSLFDVSFSNNKEDLIAQGLKNPLTFIHVRGLIRHPKNLIIFHFEVRWSLIEDRKFKIIILHLIFFLHQTRIDRIWSPLELKFYPNRMFYRFDLSQIAEKNISNFKGGIFALRM